VSLSQRVALARRYKADLFIALHANEIDDPSIHGLSVYTLSGHASDAVARAAANSENQADRQNRSDVISGINLTRESTDVAHILIDLVRRETMNQSNAFAQEIVHQLGRAVPLLQRTHRSADFAVLKALDVPSVLIEMGYLSNPTEERHLCEPSYRRKLDSAIVRAVNLFFTKTGDHAGS
jgi:N-acetylmuramoyl-L-alanine amidase